MTSRTSASRAALARATRRSDARPRAGAAGFTLIEMMVVLSILGILMGISISAFRHSIPSRDVARNAVLDAIRQARLFATSEDAPASVRIEPGNEDRWPTVSALGRRTVGGWHLEGTDLDGWPDAASGGGIEEEPHGVVGKAVTLSATEPSWLDFGAAPAYDAPDGFALECFLRIVTPRNQLLFTKGKAFTLRSETDGGLTAQVRVAGKDDKGDVKPVFHSVSSEGAILEPGRFKKIAVSYDGVQLRLVADDVIVGEFVLQARADFLPDREANLLCGSVEAPAGFTLDEVKWGIFAGDTQELRDMEVGKGDLLIRFGPDGALDPRFHTAPARICLITPGSDADHPPLETWIRVGLLGDVH